MIISIIGPPASGKTMLCRKIAEKYGLHYLAECSALPPRIIENLNQGQRFLETQIWFHNEMVSNILKADELSKKGKDVIMDTCWKVFSLYTQCEGTDNFENELLEEMASFDDILMPNVDLLVGLSCSITQLEKNMEIRKADYEQGPNSRVRVTKLLAWHEAFYSNFEEVHIIDIEGVNLNICSEFVNIADRIFALIKNKNENR